MMVLDASVVVCWFSPQPGADHASVWLERMVEDPDLFVAPDLLHFEVYGALARLQPARDSGWSRRAFARFVRLGIRTLPTPQALFDRALDLSRTLKIAGYDAIYVAHAEALGTEWLTADGRLLRRLAGDPRIRSVART
jgi:predicted nucleic acid-binding protein